MLGTWQGLHLLEHRELNHTRRGGARIKSARTTSCSPRRPQPDPPLPPRTIATEAEAPMRVAPAVIMASAVSRHGPARYLHLMTAPTV